MDSTGFFLTWNLLGGVLCSSLAIHEPSLSVTASSDAILSAGWLARMAKFPPNIQPESPFEDWMWAMLDTFIVISSLWDIVMDSWPKRNPQNIVWDETFGQARVSGQEGKILWHVDYTMFVLMR